MVLSQRFVGCIGRKERAYVRCACDILTIRHYVTVSSRVTSLLEMFGFRLLPGMGFIDMKVGILFSYISLRYLLCN